MIKQRFGIEPMITDGGTGKFDVIVDGETIVERGGNSLTRIFGAGYPDPGEVVEQIAKRVGR
jgi:hypothetical protein